VVVSAGLVVLIAVAVIAIVFVRTTSSDVVAVASSAFGVLGSIVGAYFGVKIGTDGTQTAIAGLKDEAAKAQAFAAHVPVENAGEAIAAAQGLAVGGGGAAAQPSGSAAAAQPTSRGTSPPTGTTHPSET
jgi:hypothetical protein